MPAINGTDTNMNDTWGSTNKTNQTCTFQAKLKYYIINIVQQVQNSHTYLVKKEKANSMYVHTTFS